MTNGTEIELSTTPAGDLDLPSLGRVLAACGYFRDATKVSQAITKILAGREIGIGPIAALRNIHIVEGKIELSATLIAALIRRHDRYDYRVTAMSDESAEVEIQRDGKPVGSSKFTIDDARRAGLVRHGSAWEKYPRNMVFARAMSNAARWFAPDVFQGEVYAEGEISDVHVVDATPAVAVAVTVDPEPVVEASEVEVAPEDPSPPVPAPDPEADDARTKSMRRLHAEAGRRSITHDELHAWATKAFGAESMTDLGAEQIDSLLAGVQAGEVPPAPGWPHAPFEREEQRSRPAQWTVIVRKAQETGADLDEIRRLFRERYGLEIQQATVDQAQAFGDWVRGWLSRRTETRS